MPARIQQRDGQHCVTEPDGTVVKCHGTRQEAMAHMQAINANKAIEPQNVTLASFPLPTEIGEGEKRGMYDKPFDQAEVNYTTLSPMAGEQACANCRFFKKGEHDNCWIVEGHPDPILPTGICDQWVAREAREEKPTVERMGDSLRIDLNGSDDKAGEYVAGDMPDKKKPKKKPEEKAQDDKSIFEKVVGIVRKLFDPEPQTDLFDLPQGFKLHPSDGNRWLAWWTNNFEDRDKQLFSEAAIDRYVKLVNDGKWPMPELWYGHIKGTRHGQADAVVRAGHFVLATGRFDDSDKNWLVDHMKGFYRDAKSVEVSHGFYYDRSKLSNDGVYDAFLTFEISALPSGMAANPYTTFDEVTKMSNILDEKAIATLKEAQFSDDFIERLSNGAEIAGKRLEEQGVRFKQKMDDASDTEAQPTPAPQTPAPASAPASEEVKPAESDKAAAPQWEAEMKSLRDQNDALSKKFDALVKSLETVLAATPRGSRSRDTLVDATDPQAAFLQQAGFGQVDLGANNGQKSFFQHIWDGQKGEGE